MVENPLPRKAFNFVIASCIVVAALSAKLALSRLWEDESPFLLFFAAVALSTWQGGLISGAFATLLSLLLASYYFIAPFQSFESSAADLLALTFFGVEALFVAWLIDALANARIQLKASLAQEERTGAQLTHTVAQVRDLNERLRIAMSETHHRVKNSLQAINSLLLQKTLRRDTISSQEVREIVSQVHGISVLHDVLTEGPKDDDETTLISAHKVLEKLEHSIKKAWPHANILFQKLDDVRLRPAGAASLAVITNELITNSIKHGAQHVVVTLARNEERVILRVSDNGRGFPPDFNPFRDANTGLQLIERLAESDFGTRPSYETRNGAIVTIAIAGGEAAGAAVAT